MKVLQFNVYFSPVSFGGATIVAENMARCLQDDYGCDVTTVTTLQDSHLSPYSLLRYRSAGLDVIGINLSKSGAFEAEYSNHEIEELIDDIVATIQPDIAHVHCVQDMGAGVLKVLKEHGVPTAVTIHDCWWLCEKQFMINSVGNYCFQEKIDLDVCRFCVPDTNNTRKRNEYLMSMLEGCDQYLFPSEFQRQLYIQNGLPAGKCFVNKNGVAKPLSGYEKELPKDDDVKVRFGFTGGPGPIKGGELIYRALKDIERTDYEMVVVDAAQNLGTSWIAGLNWEVPGQLRIEPAYTQETMDAFFSTIDVLLFPSQWKESFGLTVREALARGVWVIATDGGGTIEDCVDGVNSTIIPMVKDHKALQQAMVACFDRDWAGYRNPKAGDIFGVKDQADDLYTHLASLKK